MGTAVTTPGLMFKSSSANMFNTVMRYVEMRVAIRHTTQDHSKVLWAAKAMRVQIMRHNIEAFNKDYKALFQHISEEEDKTHQLAINDFIAMKVLAKLSHEFDATEDKIGKELKRAAERPTIMTKRDLLRQIVTFKREHKRGEMREENDKRAVLRKCRLLVNGIYHLCEGHMDSALFIRAKTFIDWRVFNYFKLRGEAKDTRKDISEGRHTYADLRKRHDMIANIAGKRVKASEAKKMAKEEEKQFKVLIGDIKKFTKLIHDAFMAMGSLFADAMLLLSISIKKIKKEDEEVRHWAEDHQLPNAIFTWGAVQEKKVLAKVKASMHEMNKDLLQLGG